jgi:hypothetical protein
MLKKYLSVLFFLTFASIGQAQAFCGFYVAKADTKIFNEASKVVIVRDEDKTVLTMANDFQGDVKEFAMVIPVPTFIKEGQIHVTENKIIDHLDAYTAPRLVEYYDDNPCRRYDMMAMRSTAAPMMLAESADSIQKRAKSLGVTIEAEYTVGEYDIVILSAKQSNGLQTFLKQEGYQIPDGAEKVLESYIKQKNRFFLAKVNLQEHAKTGNTYLRPIQVAFESPKFMLPIRLGTVNARDSQELFIFTITRKGRVEPTNYRQVKLPTGMEIPTFVKEEFPDFYRAMFETQVKKEDMRAVFLEYAWDMNWCDPCAADPLSPKELRELGAFWIPASQESEKNPDIARPMPATGRPPMVLPRRGKQLARDAYVTRMHVRYNAETFPEDLMFQQTSDRQNFQGRYVMRHPWDGKANECEAAKNYLQRLPKRRDEEAKTLANLTGWSIKDIRSKMDMGENAPEQSSEDKGAIRQWWEDLWD